MVQPFVGNPKVFGFYLADEPGPGVSAADLKAKSDYIHAVDPGAKTFIVLENNGSPTSVSYAFNPANTDVDLFGLDPYPIRPEFAGGADYSVIGDAVNAAEAEGIPQSAIVPVYQTFGATAVRTRSWTLPTPAQEQTILSTWGQMSRIPHSTMRKLGHPGRRYGTVRDDPACRRCLPPKTPEAAARRRLQRMC